MVLISLSPLSFRRVAFFVLGLICCSSAATFADSAFMPVSSTPYDRQMTRIRPVLTSNASSHDEKLTLGVVNQWIQDLRAIPYGFSTEWKTPSEVENGPVADCKGKAVALYQKMHASGAHNLRLVIGKRLATSRKTHAWLEWNTNEGTYVLDPTINWSAYRTASLSSRSYIPLYAYAGQRKYRAATMGLFARN